MHVSWSRVAMSSLVVLGVEVARDLYLKKYSVSDSTIGVNDGTHHIRLFSYTILTGNLDVYHILYT